MKSIILLPLCFAFAFGLGEPYSFGYTTADGQSRQESGAHGNVQGSYSYTDANGDFRKVDYIADANGFRPSGDIGIDRRTAEAAEQIAELAPKGTNYRDRMQQQFSLGFTGYLPQQSRFSQFDSQLAHQTRFSQYDTQFAAPIGAQLTTPYISQLASPMLGLKTSYGSLGTPYNMIASAPAFSSFNTAINHGSQLLGSQLLSPAATLRGPANFWK